MTRGAFKADEAKGPNDTSKFPAVTSMVFTTPKWIVVTSCVAYVESIPRFISL